MRVDIGSRRLGDSQKIISNVDKFMTKFDWKPKYNDLKYILKTAYEWEKRLI